MDKFESFENETRRVFRDHSLFEQTHLSLQQLTAVFSQYFEPLHYFPNFLSHLTALLPSLAQKTFVSQILYQELGEGIPHRAHEVAFLDCLKEMGISEDAIHHAPIFRETTELMTLYRDSSTNLELALGMLFATEVADLAIITGLHKLIKGRLGGAIPLWVKLHVEQEPDHVQASTATLCVAIKGVDSDKVLDFARDCAQAWHRFFTAIEQEVCISERKIAVGVK